MAVARAERAPHCPACGYCLAGIASMNCPECGRRFHPEDEDLYRHRTWHWEHWAAALCLAAWAAPILSVLLKPRDYPIFNPATPNDLLDQGLLLAARFLYWAGFPLALAALAIAFARLSHRLWRPAHFPTCRPKLSSFVLVLVILAAALYLAACTWMSFLADFD